MTEEEIVEAEVIERPEAPAVQDPLAMMDTGRWNQANRVAMTMSQADALPEHLKGDTALRTVANCLLVVEQADRWGLSPFAIMGETYVVHGKLGWQGKLIAGLVNSMTNLEGRLRYHFSGSGDDLTCTCVGKFDDEDDPRDLTCRLGDWKTYEFVKDRAGKRTTKKQVKPMWLTMPNQKLSYTTATQWARMHCPEILLGARTVEDLEREAESIEPAEIIEVEAMEESLDVFAAAGKDEEPTVGDAKVEEVSPGSPNPMTGMTASEAAAAEEAAPKGGGGPELASTELTANLYELGLKETGIGVEALEKMVLEETGAPITELTVDGYDAVVRRLKDMQEDQDEVIL